MLRFVFVTLAILSVALGTSVQFTTFDSNAVAGLQLNGIAASRNPNSENILILTPSSGNAVGSAFLKSSINLTADASFSSAFSFRMDQPGGSSDDDGQGADGIVFIINSVTNNVGSIGSGIGYQGLSNSVGIEFDTYNNGQPTDINGNHVGIDINGDVASKASRAYTPSRLNNGQLYYAWVDYNGANTTLEVRISSTPARPVDAFLSYRVNLREVLGTPTVYVGFSSATGGAWNRHLIAGWEFAPQYAPIADVPSTPTSVCGNNVVEAGEQCDGGACCTGTCTFASSASVCRPAANGCDIAETCSGASSTCPADKLSQTGPCFCGRQGVTEPKDFPEYFCSATGNLTIFYQCVYGAFLPQSSIMNCGAGTTCGCPNGGECSCNATRSPCVWANTLQQC